MPAGSNGYAADLTRTWSAKSDNDYAQLVKDVNDEQLALIATMKAGVSYVDYHIQFHQRIAKLLRKHQIITDMSEEAMVKNDRTVYAARYWPSAGPAGA
ncbi:M24 family metallopeptidase [Escherichia coli]